MDVVPASHENVSQDPFSVIVIRMKAEVALTVPFNHVVFLFHFHPVVSEKEPERWQLFTVSSALKVTVLKFCASFRVLY